MIFKYRDGGAGADAAYKALLDLKAGIVGVMEDAELRVAALAVEVEASRAVGVAVEVDPPVR